MNSGQSSVSWSFLSLVFLYPFRLDGSLGDEQSRKLQLLFEESQHFLEMFLQNWQGGVVQNDEQHRFTFLILRLKTDFLNGVQLQSSQFLFEIR